MKFLFAVLALVVAAPAFAQEATTTKLGGGCLATKHFGDICLSPDAAASVVAFKHDGPVAGLMPGVGYKGEIFSERWYTLGAGAYIALQTGSDHSGVFTALGSFARYLRAGAARDLYSNTPWYPVLGLGMDFGPSK